MALWYSFLTVWNFLSLCVLLARERWRSLIHVDFGYHPIPYSNTILHGKQ